MTILQALATSGIDSREARLLLAAVTGLSEASVLAHGERPLRPEVETSYLQMVSRRAGGEPVAYILGRKEFYGLELAVDPAVLVPRPETELLVELALQQDFSTAVDLGTGSGAIALALKRERPQAQIAAVDASAAALAVAQGNAARHRLQIEFRHGSWFEPLAERRFDLIVCNPPYVAARDSHLEALRHEPQGALVSGADGLAAIREIIRGAPDHLTPGSRLLVEHGAGQDAAVRSLLIEAGLEDVRTWPDLAGIPRVSGAKR